MKDLTCPICNSDKLERLLIFAYDIRKYKCNNCNADLTKWDMRRDLSITVAKDSKKIGSFIKKYNESTGEYEKEWIKEG